MTLSQGLIINDSEDSSDSDTDTSPSLSSAGDFNGDGFMDIIIGKYLQDVCFILFGNFSSNFENTIGLDFITKESYPIFSRFKVYGYKFRLKFWTCGIVSW